MPSATSTTVICIGFEESSCGTCIGTGSGEIEEARIAAVNERRPRRQYLGPELNAALLRGESVVERHFDCGRTGRHI